jgi:hypothetical protein
MSLGKRRSGREFTPVIKFDARVGTFFLEDRERNSSGEWETHQHDVTQDFEAILDMANAEQGWVKLAKGVMPDCRMVAAGGDPGDPPGDEFKEGVRLYLQVSGKHAETGPREFISTALGVWDAVSDLHDKYMAGVAEHPAMLPVIALADVREVKGKTVSFAPIFQIVRWTARPPSLPAGGIASAAKKRGATARQKAQGEFGADSEIPF